MSDSGMNTDGTSGTGAERGELISGPEGAVPDNSGGVFGERGAASQLVATVGASGAGGAADGTEDGDKESVSEPAKVMRVGSMIKQLLDEVRDTTLDEPARERLRTIYDTSVAELGSALSPDLRDELSRLAFPFTGEEAPTEVELRVAQAQLVGWLEGLFHGIQATLFAQQMAARQQLENMRQQLPPGVSPSDDRPGTYL